MYFDLFDLLSLIGALGLFIFGMKVMSDAIQKVAGVRLRHTLEVMTSRRIFGLFTGLLITGLVQSSSATTVMVVSFANAGLISLVESIGVIMGANIGTTITGWIISELGLGRFSIASLSLPILAVGFPMMFSGRDRLKLWGEVFVGFAILFLGLSFMQESVSGLRNEELLSWIQDFSYTDRPYFLQIPIIILFVLIGIMLTIVVQSSSAAMALTLVMTYEGWISFPLAAAIILGENIGTTITANLAAIVGNVHAKRAARAHFLFNVLGVAWMILVFPWFLKMTAAILELFGAVNPFTEVSGVPRALALFHTLFNVFNVLLLIGFTRSLARMAMRITPSRRSGDDQFSLDYINSGMLDTSELSIVEARRELMRFAELVRRAFKYVPMLVTEMDEKRLDFYNRQLHKHEEMTDHMELEITTYLSKVSSNELSSDASLSVRRMINIAHYLERIGDVYLEISRNLHHRKQQKAYFTQEMRDDIVALSEKVSLAMDVMVQNIEAPENQADLERVRKLEDDIDRDYEKLRDSYVKKVEKGKFRFRSGMYYSDLIADLERIADYVAKVSELLESDKQSQSIQE
jgi:phosphate:Na+ symporter